ncbi:hypothetical protein [Rhizobium sp. CF080]|uniref:DUF6896 domain-containing protein n=1 Tax=Rhizobium sp. (strain CF080) TaxID=1144310 RepID=UPI0012DF5985|nr:hypothetical protein [Rhizobium sp. CF080]
MSDFLHLVHEYVAEVKMCIDLFDQHFGRKDIVRAWREGKLPQTGILPGNIRYQIHGKGCQVEFATHDIDFDFADWEGNFGFDAWKLWLFASQFPEKYPQLQHQGIVEEEMKRYVLNGSISAINDDMTLYMPDN